MTRLKRVVATHRSILFAAVAVSGLVPIPGLALAADVPAAAVAARRPAGAASSAWPADSLYQVDVPLQTSTGVSTSFSASRAGARIVTMFYSNCPMACPLTIDTLRNVDSALSDAQRANLDILMLTMDPVRDTPAALTSLRMERRITDERWTVARASLGDTRKLAAVLGIQYRALDNGDFDHASELVLLDEQGRVLARNRKMGAPEPEFLVAVRAAATPTPKN